MEEEGGVEEEIMEKVAARKGTRTLPPKAISITVRDNAFAPASSARFCPLREPGPHLPDGIDIGPLALFELYFDEKVVNRLIECTLAYADKVKDDLIDSYYQETFH